jgi:hypothetical protein
MLHCEIKKELDGTITASSPEVSLIIIPTDEHGKGNPRAFNRNFQRNTINDKKLHAKLNNLAARIQQGHIDEVAAWEEMEKEIEHRHRPIHKRVLVGELNGVRVYISDSSIILTTKDLYE